MRAIVLVLLALQIAPAAAQDQWREFKSDSDGFSVTVPGTPTVTSRRIGKSDATQSMFLIEQGQVTYLVSVIQMAKGTGPKNPNAAYYQNLLKNYANGSKTTPRTTSPTKVAGLPGFEGISDVGGSAHVTRIAASGDRVFMLVYVGAKGQERGPDATRFQESFKILN